VVTHLHHCSTSFVDFDPWLILDSNHQCFVSTLVIIAIEYFGVSIIVLEVLVIITLQVVVIVIII